MRIIEPTQHARQRKKSPKLRIFLGALLVITLAGFVWVRTPRVVAPDGDRQQVTSTENTQNELSSSSTPKKLKQFSAEELKQFMDTFAYPNVSDITTKPEITGNIATDEHIRSLAEGRGYRQRAIPNTSLVKVDGYLLQQKAVEPWKALKKAADSAGLNLDISSGFRPVDEQRDIFNDRLRASGATNASIAAGRADSLVISVLKTTAVPGYSKHHTGFTIDLICDGVGLEAFTRTPCFTWLTANNHEQAKLAGWIPSYPAGASLQGPDPEPWEYVWVGTESLYE